VPFLCVAEPAPTALYPLSLHDALPISARPASSARSSAARSRARHGSVARSSAAPAAFAPTSTPLTAASSSDATARVTRTSTRVRSEEHTSELQSRENLVCRLLLEKKKK